MDFKALGDKIFNLSNCKSSIFYWKKNAQTIKLRVYFLIIIFSILFFILTVRVLTLSLLTKESLENSKTVTTERLAITDRNGNVLAVNLPSSSLYLNPKKLLSAEQEIAKLSTIFPSINPKILSTKLTSDKSFIWIKRDITPLEQQKIYDLGLVGFGFEREQKRFYTYGSLLSHVVGYVDRDLHGLAGIEKYYDKFLTSQPELEDRRVLGDQLQLSIDVRLQTILSEEIDKTMKKFSAKGAAGIIVNPNNGEILALVSKPDFDPHYPGKAAPEQLFNMATQGVYEVGSSMKGLTVAIGIDNGSTSIRDAYDLSYMKVGGFQIKDYYSLKGWHSVPHMFLKSSNIGMGQIILEVGKENFVNYIRKLGLLDKLKIELPERARPLFPNYSRINDLSLTIMSYGYGISNSPMHFVQALIPVVNGGMFYPVTLIKQTQNPQGERIFKESTSRDLRKLMRLVVSEGTGSKAEVKGYYVGGKTGTAEIVENGKYNKNKRMSSFMGIMPATNPQYLIYIIFNEPVGHKESFGFAGGGWTAAPTVGAVFSRIISMFGIKPLEEDSDEVIELNDIEYKISNET
jgi:cell division protein FtsI (penicillin-binding protein 3)